MGVETSSVTTRSPACQAPAAPALGETGGYHARLCANGVLRTARLGDSLRVYAER